jgi:hypothetical protein
VRSPYSHMSAREVERLDLILLDGLSHCGDAASTDAVIHISDPRGFAQIDTEQAIYQLTMLVAEGYVSRLDSKTFKGGLQWQITEKGRAHLIATETRSVIAEVTRHTPIRTTNVPDKPQIEEVAEMDLPARLRASHAKLNRDGVPPAGEKLPSVVTVPLDEDELDDWWSSLAIADKAAAFIEYSLMESGPRIITSEPKIPILGTIGAGAQIVSTEVRDPFQVGGEKRKHECVTGGD